MPPRSFRAVALAGALAFSLFAPRLEAQISMRATRVAAGLVTPVGAWSPPGDYGRLFLLELAAAGSGRIRVLDLAQNPPALQSTPYLTIAPILAGGEEGLLGLAFHPGFATNGYFFVFYTNTLGNHQVVRYQANAPYMSSGTANPASATAVMTITHPLINNHNGGWLGFGPDGYLYIATGEGNGTAQNLGTRLGKILRVDVDSDAFPSDPANNYANPTGNPFLGTSGALPEIWHYGLRNPFRASFDRQTGDLWIGEVGGAAFEEIDFAAAGVGGRNYAWGCMEGFNCNGGGACICPDPALAQPVHAYAHTSGNGCVIGGYRYRGAALCDFQGLYFFGDFNSSRIWSVEWNGSGVQNLVDRTAELNSGSGPPITLITSFGEDARGEIYVCDALGDVYRIDPGAILDCNQNSIHDPCDLAGGSSHDWNGNGTPDECEPAGTTNCFGDGTTPTPCPCSNAGAVGRGCENSALTGGARLEGYGDPQLDEVVLSSAGELPTSMTLFLQGTDRNLNGVVFGDGVRCTTGLLIRLYAVSAVGGMAHAPNPGDASICARSTALGDPVWPMMGERRFYQAFYRDPSLGLCAAQGGDRWNMSSMLTIFW
jgi:glucose/arabinose dehydrogenase